jgi:hypothetical protein
MYIDYSNRDSNSSNCAYFLLLDRRVDSQLDTILKFTQVV